MSLQYDNRFIVAKGQSRLIFLDHDKWTLPVMQNRWQGERIYEGNTVESPGVVHVYAI